MKKIGFALLGLVTGGMLLTSCLKTEDNTPDIPVAGLMAFNLATDKEGITINLSGNNINNQPLAFGNYTGGYVNIYPGTRPTMAIDAYSGAAITSTTNYTYDSSRYYSLFTIGADSNYSNIIVEDGLDSLDLMAGKAWVRFIHAIPDSGQAVILLSAAGSGNITENSSFGTVSEFAAVNAGEITVSISNDANINVSRTFAAAENKVYTVLLMGDPNATDPGRAVQIKYIVNGTVTDNNN
ncbi:DUF4397 domain-containing protein [Flavihumibacter stibioxidans]|uniref:DUF4397 domain-containing protein n=1 Tax=Flavihumibacter stibioxidans TaxID=1834163 RepID=UPI00164F94C0|nr:DUF4397 domain-containing protein [Flavihumibacter stibioxidans]